MHTLTSRDGTGPRSLIPGMGSGPSVVLVGGALDDGTENATLIPALAERFTVVNYARRGRGGSDDTPPYSLAREIEDLTAVVSSAGGSAHLFGASSGGALALEAAASGVSALRIAVYDVPYSATPEAVSAWQTYIAQLGDALAEGIGTGRSNCSWAWPDCRRTRSSRRSRRRTGHRYCRSSTHSRTTLRA